MPAPRLSQSAEAARAAAAQAEFNEKKWVWVPDDKEGYLAGWVHNEDGEYGDIIMAAGGEASVALFTLSKMNPPKFDRVDDIADLTFLNEASVVHNLRLRFGSGAIYTYSGLFLVAVNPYQNLPLYSDAIVHQYRSKRRDENAPHIFAVAERAWVNMGEERENQSILITGESGAGKTESTKKVIQYLAAIATDVHQGPSTPSHSRSPTVSGSQSFSNMPSTGLPRTNSTKRGHALTNSITGSGFALTAKGRLGLLERQILQANPILEAFGNAQTQRNNNSSRFGKFVRISFAPDGSIAGANIDWYLLEKSRVVVRSEAERSFHVFYQLLAGGIDLKEKLLLGGGVEDYEFLNKSRREVDGVDDGEEWNALKAALDVVGFTPSEQYDLFRIVAAILHIGNIAITSTRADDAVMPDPSQAERVCHLLGVPPVEFTRAVLRPRVLAGREWVTQARTGQQALQELAALSKTLYEKSFGLLVDRINQALDRPFSKSTFIGVLDIAGFEIFDVNTYEQLLINYTNEKLQQFFNHHMFVLEQEEYSREGIKWDYVNFGLDLQPTIDLIESSGNGGAIGILSCLDEECIMPKATDTTFTHKLHSLWTGAGGDPDDPQQNHPGREKYEPARFEQGFLVQHYAAKVEYRTDGWLEKNKDPLNDNLTRVFASSTERYVSSLFVDYINAPTPGAHQTMFSLGKKRGMKKGAFRTVGQRHKEQLASLMGQLMATQPHFVRCIVPNNNKKPGRVDVPLVLDQLRCNGVLEGIRIARLGYPNRLPFVEFRHRYEILTPDIIPKGYMDGREACRRMIGALELDETIFKIGMSKIFFKAGVLADLEERRDMLLYDLFSRLQAVARMWTARRQIRKILNRAVAIRTIQRNARIYGELRDWPWWQLYTKVRPLLAATRSDEELRRKEAELIIHKERAERDKQEKEALENLKMTLEAEKNKIEDQLEAERALNLDKDTLLERSKKHEAELEEEIAELQADIDELQSHLDRAMAMAKDSEQRHAEQRDMFDQAAEHLVRLENEQKQMKLREEETLTELTNQNEEIDRLHNDLQTLHKVSDDLKQLAMQREEDLSRARDRTDLTVKELEGKLEVELRNKDILKGRADTLEQELRQAKEQVVEMDHTVTDYSNLIQKKDDRIAELLQELEQLAVEHQQASKEILELQSDLDTLAAELEAEKVDHARGDVSRARTQAELDELRSLLEAKTSEETRRNEVEKSKELELTDLRSQVAKTQQELTDTRRSALENQGKLRVDLEQSARELASLQSSYEVLAKQERDAQSAVAETRSALSELEKGKRSMESELQSLRSRTFETETALAEVQKIKEASRLPPFSSLDRQLSAAQNKYHGIEDVMLQLERDKTARERQFENVRKQFESESTRRSQLEKALSAQKVEVAKLKDHNVKADRDLNKALKDLKDREWDIKQLESKQDKTIVEHVHVLEEAKRVTDRQLTDAQEELQKNAAYIRSLEKAKLRLTSEAEDLLRETERERMELRGKEKAVRNQEDRVARAVADVEQERRARQEAELQVRRMQLELQNTSRHADELSQQLLITRQSKSSLEAELEHLANETPGTDSLAKVQRQYQARIAQLEEQVGISDDARLTAMRKLSERIQRQHADIRKLITDTGPSDSTFQSRLLHELQVLDDELASDIYSKNVPQSNHDIRPSTPSSKSKRHSSREAPRDTNKFSDTQIVALKQQVQVLELQMAASERVRHHLETSIREMTADLENSDGSKQFLQQYRSRLAKENKRLAELLEEEADARRSAEAAQIDGIQAVWAKFQKTIHDERQSYAKLEETRKALHLQHRTMQADFKLQQTQLQDALQVKNTLQSQAAELNAQLEVAQSAISGLKRQIHNKQMEEDIASSATSAIHSDLRAATETFKSKEQSYQERLENAEIARVKATRAEASVRRTLSEIEKAQADTVAKLKSNEDLLRAAHQRIKELEKKLHEEGNDSVNLVELNQRLAEELEDEKTQHQKDLGEHEFASNQTRKKYQGTLSKRMLELQSQRDTLTRLREDNRKIRSDYDELQLRFDDEVYSSGGWRKEKERLETKIHDINKAYDASTAAQTEQQSQIVALHSQVRELRGVLDDVEADRALLQKARRALQAELEGIKLDHVDIHKLSTDQQFQRLFLEKQDLERSLDEQEDRVANAFDRMKKAEAFANECQIELGKVRVDNSELDRINANLENQVKELNVRIIDLETKSYASSSRPATLSRKTDGRIEEITSQLTGKGHAHRLSRDSKFDLDRQRVKLDEERKGYEMQLATFRKSIDELHTQDNLLQSAKRRAEREAADYKQKSLNLEREVERLRSRLERPASAFGSPTSSPRK
ncbi:nonmuscle myosin heavy chain b [Lentinula detonsa]|uniref:Nonmuscle myosin heavy chain b n=1 Tax=Lentinula detonsa TaxID=2804962 RepID=A0AA38UV72_9AGAR|nr:nonmuscle myosin heavy chain b [Lentinula detonsa]